MPGCWMVIFRVFGIGVTNFLKIKFWFPGTKNASGFLNHDEPQMKSILIEVG